MRLLVAIVIILCNFSALADQKILQPLEAFTPTIDYQNKRVDIEIQPGHYLYADKLYLITTNGKIALSAEQQPLQFVDPILKGNISIYRDHISFLVSTTDSTLSFQGCSDSGFCYPPVSFPLTKSNFSSFLLILFAAFIGGILLNLMPCILPILGLKIQAIRNSTHKSQGLFYALGILFTTTTLGGILAMANLLGKQLNWGFYIQLPIVVSLLIFTFIYLIFLQFNWVKPLFSFTTKNRQGVIGDFLSGATTIFIAGSCAAPFMAGAISSVLTHSFLETILIFFVLGIGIATPISCFYLLPQSITIIPRSGKWQRILQGIIVALMIITLIWLCYVLISQTGYIQTLAVICSCLMLVLALSYNQVLLSVISALCIILPASFYGMQMTESDIQAKINQAISTHQGVFVNITASWCITCKTNEWHTLRYLRPQLVTNNIAYLEFDWSNPNPNITNFLSSFSRNSIPFYAYYPYNSRVPIILPQILQLDDTLSLIKRK